MHNFDILGLEAFVAIADLGSFTRAAEYLHISQTALSRRLSKLEAAVGGMLIARSTRSLQLTQPGTLFLPRARRLVRELSAAMQELKDSTMHGYGQVVFGCLPTITANLLSPVIAEYGRAFPRNRLQILDRSATEIREAVQHSDAEFGISVLPKDTDGLIRHPLFADPMVLACPAQHDFSRRKTVSWSELSNQSLIGIGALSGLRVQIEMVAKQHAFDIRHAYEVQHLATAVGLAAGGAGIAVLPRGACSGLGASGLKLIPLVEPRVERIIEVFVREGHTLSPAAKPLFQLLKQRLAAPTA